LSEALFTGSEWLYTIPGQFDFCGAYKSNVPKKLISVKYRKSEIIKSLNAVRFLHRLLNQFSSGIISQHRHEEGKGI